MKRKIKYLLILLVVTFAFLGYEYFKHAGTKAYYYVNNTEVSLDSLADGSYIGTFSPLNIIPVAKVQFNIENGKVEEFTISRLIVSPWNKVKPAIQKKVRETQSVRFDAISGATRSSFFVKAAVHQACQARNMEDKKTKE